MSSKNPSVTEKKTDIQRPDESTYLVQYNLGISLRLTMNTFLAAVFNFPNNYFFNEWSENYKPRKIERIKNGLKNGTVGSKELWVLK